MAKKAAPKPAEAKAAPKASGTPKAAAGAAAGAAPAKANRVKTATKGEIFAAIAEKTNLAKKDVAAVFDAMGEMIKKELNNKKGGQFVIPGLIKLKVESKAATKEKPGINPFTKEPMTIKAKPARKVIRARPLKALKDFV